MSHFINKIPPFFFALILTLSCNSQVKDHVNHDGNRSNRPTAVAGLFYPGNNNELSEMLSGLFNSAVPKKIDKVRAIIVPHAGYIFSGHVAASAYNQIDPAQAIDNVFIIASSHKAFYNGASIYSIGNYLTPLGEVQVNHEIVNKLLQYDQVFNFVPEAHEKEHSVEVQIPFLQHLLGNRLKIVPVLIGTRSTKDCRTIAEILKPYFTDENLFVVSSDFSHYPGYEDALAWDRKTAESILSNSPVEFLAALNDHADDHIPNLVTRACGWTSILTLLYLSEENPELEYKEIIYQNSGDSKSGNKQEVVGYYAIGLRELESSGIIAKYQLSEEEKDSLLKFARNAILAYLKDEKPLTDGVVNLPDNLKITCGAFVSLHHKGQLRGCIGTFTTDEPLYKVVTEMSIAAATQDKRFIPVTLKEMEEIDIEISVLTPLKRITSTDEIILGKHGIYIKKGYHTGTFLPQVAKETNWTKEEYLGHCARDKAGIGWNGWKDAEIFIYEAFDFSE